MNLYKKLSLYVALASLGTLVATGPAQAVNVSADGRGQVLLYPYYTTRVDGAGNAYATLLSVVNATAFAKAVKVKFLEGKNSREVFNFNLFLSPFDVWTAGVLADIPTGGAKVGTFDGSCTLPAFSTSPTAPFYGFANFAYSGVNDDGAGTGLERTTEGHFEIIEMATYASSSTTGKAITHVNGMPPCGSNLSDAQAANDAQPPAGGLFGSVTLINVNSGTDYTADAVALANFFQAGTNYQASGTSLPDLSQASPPVSAIQAPNGMLYEALWGTGTADPVSAVLMHDSLMNEFVLDSVTKSGTDWVVTMPTKRFYVGNGTGNASRLFQRNFDASAGSCDDVKLNIWDREERTQTGPLNFTPPPPTPSSSICWGANVITFNNTNVLGSMNVANLQSPGFQNGLLTIGFPTGIAGASATVHQLINNGSTSISGGGRATTTGNTTTYFGLPVIGFAVMSYQNGTLQVGTPPTSVLSNYGGNFVHKTNTTIQISSTPPTGCVATLNGGTTVTLPSSGGSVNLAVAGCIPSTGLSYNWAKNGTFGANIFAGWTDPLGPNTTTTNQTVSYQVQVCSGGRCVTVPSTPLTVLLSAASTGLCPGFATTHVIDFNWANPGRITVLNFKPMDAIVARFTTGNVDSADNNLPIISGAEWISPPSARYAVLSDAPCDFGPQVWPGATSTGNSVQVPFAIGSGSNFNYYPILKKNTTYYFNVKMFNQAQSCTAQGICDMFIGLGHSSGL